MDKEIEGNIKKVWSEKSVHNSKSVHKNGFLLINVFLKFWAKFEKYLGAIIFSCFALLNLSGCNKKLGYGYRRYAIISINAR